GIGAAFKLATTLFGVFKARVVRETPFYRGARAECETSPELLAVGYIIGYETSVIMVAGGLLSALILGPMVVFFGSQLTTPLAPALGDDDCGAHRDVSHLPRGRLERLGVLVRGARRRGGRLHRALERGDDGAGPEDGAPRGRDAARAAARDPDRRPDVRRRRR